MSDAKTTGGEKTKHSSAPWELREDGFNFDVVANVTKDRHGTSYTKLAKVYGNATSTVLTPANARLIAAAPDLLTIAKRLIAAEPWRRVPAMLLTADVEALEELVAKIEGRAGAAWDVCENDTMSW